MTKCNGKFIPEGHKFCQHCGQPMEEHNKENVMTERQKGFIAKAIEAGFNEIQAAFLLEHCDNFVPPDYSDIF